MFGFSSSIALVQSELSDYPFLLFYLQGESSASHAPLEPAMSSEQRKEQWEQGQADYMGMDSFDNIQRKLDTFLK